MPTPPIIKYLGKSIFLSEYEYLPGKISPPTKKKLSYRLETGRQQCISLKQCVVFTECQRVTDRRRDRQTDIPIVANTGLCIASYADVL